MATTKDMKGSVDGAIASSSIGDWPNKHVAIVSTSNHQIVFQASKTVTFSIITKIWIFQQHFSICLWLLTRREMLHDQLWWLAVAKQTIAWTVESSTISPKGARKRVEDTVKQLSPNAIFHFILNLQQNNSNRTRNVPFQVANVVDDCTFVFFSHCNNIRFDRWKHNWIQITRSFSNLCWFWN